MARKTSTVHALATRSGRAVEDVILQLIDNGFNISGPSEQLKDKRLFDAEMQLGLAVADNLLVKELAKQAGMGEERAREILYEKNVLIKRRLKRIPRRFLRDARVALGIVTVASDQDTAADVHVADKRPSASTTRKAKENWPIIGKSERVVQLRAGDVEDIHYALLSPAKYYDTFW